MENVIMAIAIVKKDNTLLLRKMDPDKNPYKQPWAIFGGRLEGEGNVNELLNQELNERWRFTVRITERLWWDEDIKQDHDTLTKRFIYLDALCQIESGAPSPSNKNEKLEWVEVSKLAEYSLNPPTRTAIARLGYL